jgi:hypothetical protein
VGWNLPEIEDSFSTLLVQSAAILNAIGFEMIQNLWHLSSVPCLFLINLITTATSDFDRKYALRF